jgi:endonuclease IV
MSNKYGILLNSNDFSDNIDVVDTILNLIREGIYDFVQLMAIPGSYNDVHAVVYEKMKGIDTVIHAPHFLRRIDPGNRELELSNLKKLEDSQKFADLLNSEIIVLHPGLGDGEQYLEESIRQFKLLNDSRVAVENLPYYPRPNCKMHGTTPKHIKKIISEVGCKFCFDFAHAICACNSLNLDMYKTFSDFIKLNPTIYHLSDGDISATVDTHLHLTKGNYDLKKIFNDFLPQNSIVTLETKDENRSDIRPWINDVTITRKLESRIVI